VRVYSRALRSGVGVIGGWVVEVHPTASPRVRLMRQQQPTVRRDEVINLMILPFDL
jgi:hypothetical protein